jgi:hypothetical protein
MSVRHFPLHVHGLTVDFYDFIDVPDSAARVARLGRFFSRMPAQHLGVVYPIFVIQQKPARGAGGGTWRPGEVRSSFMGRTSNTRVPDEWVEKLITNRGKGLIGIPRERWTQTTPEITVLHEVAHSVDYSLGLIPAGATIQDFRGVRYPKERVAEYAAEAYARFIYATARVCRDGSIPPGESQSACTSRLIGVLRRSPAFRSLPAGWMPA